MVKNPPANVGDARDVGLVPGWEDPLQEGMATHSSILAWRIPWREEADRLQSMGLQSTGRDLATEHTRDHYWFQQDFHFPGILVLE